MAGAAYFAVSATDESSALRYGDKSRLAALRPCGLIERVRPRGARTIGGSVARCSAGTRIGGGDLGLVLLHVVWRDERLRVGH